MKKIIFIIYLFLFSNLYGFELKLEKIFDGMNKPWSLSFINENSILYTEKRCKLFYLDFKKKIITEIKHNLSVLEDGQGGLLDVLYDNENIYVSYSEQREGGKKSPCFQKGDFIIIFLKLSNLLFFISKINSS